jgi:hypothetical protein
MRAEPYRQTASPGIRFNAIRLAELAGTSLKMYPEETGLQRQTVFPGSASGRLNPVN